MTTAPAADRGPSRKEAAGWVGGLYARHGRMVYGVCRAMLRDVDEAEDATQQVFLSAYSAALGGTTVREPAAWLATIARNECRARIAAGMRRPLSVVDEDLDLLPAPGDEDLRRSQLEALRNSLAQLPQRQREAVVLRYLYGLRYGEVATALGLSRPATEALLFRARRAMRVRLRPIVGAALVVPTVVRDELALALPGFGGGAGAGAAAAGVTGGLLAKLTAGSVGAKAATAAVAVSTVGAVSAVPSERAERADERPAIAAETSRDEGAQSGTGVQVESEDERGEDLSTSGSSERSGPSDGDDVSHRSGSGESGESRAHDTSSESSGSESSGPSDTSGASGPSEGSGLETTVDSSGHAEPDVSNSGPGSGDSSGHDSSNSGSGSSGDSSGHSGSDD